MAQRGEVIALRRRIGFGPSGTVERFVVVQADVYNRLLDTVVVAPLDRAFEFYDDLPGAVPVSAVEAGAGQKQVVLLPQVASVPAAQFEPSPVGKLRPGTLARVGGELKLVLDLE